MNSQQPPQQTIPPLSASLAMAFFAHHFLGVMNDYTTSAMIFRVYSGGTNVPCQTNVQVNTEILANQLLVIAFWHLRENNCIRFAPAGSQGFPKHHPPLVIEFNRAAQTNIAGLEFDLMEIIKCSAPGATVETIVAQFLQRNSSRPQIKVFERITEWFVHLGYGQPPPASSGFFIKTRNPKNIDFDFIPDCRRIAGAELTAQAIHRRWTNFQTAEPEVFRLLSGSVSGGVSTRTYSID